MVRPPLTAAERERGRRLGALLRAARGSRSPAEIAAASGVSLEALRKIPLGGLVAAIGSPDAAALTPLTSREAPARRRGCGQQPDRARRITP